MPGSNDSVNAAVDAKVEQLKVAIIELMRILWEFLEDYIRQIIQEELREVQRIPLIISLLQKYLNTLRV